MKRLYFQFLLKSIFFLFLYLGCSSYDKYSKNEFLVSKEITKNIYCEWYRVESFGVGGDVYSVYLTDSLTFRKFIMLYYDHDYVEFELMETAIVAKRISEVMSPNFHRRDSVSAIIELNIDDLRAYNRFD